MPEYKTTSGNQYVPDIINIQQLLASEKDRIKTNLAKNLYPFGYHFPISRFVVNGVLGIKSNYRENLDRPEAKELSLNKDRLALLSKYFGKDSGVRFEDSYRESEYKPSLSTNNSSKYFTINSDNVEERINRLEPQGMNSTIGYGKDDKGEYYSVYDLWDLNPLGESGERDASRGLGTPIELYDRVYNTPENQRVYQRLQTIYNDRKNKGYITSNGNTYTNEKVKATFKVGGKINYTKFFK